MDAYPVSQIPAALGRLERETGMFLATVDSLSDEELRAPSKCEGWTRAHVATHVARNADALGNLIEWARTGNETPAYASPEARDRDIEEGAERPASEIKEDVRAACARFAQAAAELRGTLAVEEVTHHSRPLPARTIVPIRMTEVIIHHDDLDTVWQLEEADPDAQLDALEEAIRRVRTQDGVPAFIIRTHEKDEWTLGDEGGPVVHGDRAGMLAWLTRGATAGVSCDGDLPDVTAYP